MQPYIRTFRAALPLSLMEFAGRLLNRFHALEVLRSLWALPTTVLPFMPSLRDRLSHHGEDNDERTLAKDFRRSWDCAVRFILFVLKLADDGLGRDLAVHVRQDADQAVAVVLLN